MKFKKGNLKRTIFINSTLVASLSLPLIAISCSSSKTNETQKLANEQFQIFNNSTLIGNLRNNIYFENFDFDGSGKTKPMSLDQIDDYILIPELSNAFDYEFVVSKSDASHIEIEMFAKEKNANNKYVNPSSNIRKTIILDGIQSLPSSDKSAIVNFYNKWLNSAITITNTNTSQTLDVSNYSSVLPSYLSANNISIETVDNEDDDNYLFDKQTNFNDFNGSIEMSLTIKNKETNLPYYVGSNNNRTITGFAKLTERNKEITDMYSNLSGTYSLSNLVKDRVVPFLSSGINSLTSITNFYQYISPLVDVVKIKETLTIITNTNSWYNINVTTSANDDSGTLTINWIIEDKFSLYQIRPQNISKSVTFNDMLTLTTKNGDDSTNYNLMNNCFNVYETFRTLKLKDNFIYTNKASSISEGDINNSWVMDNTNIGQIFNGISINGDYLTFTFNGTNFRTKIDPSSLSEGIESNDVLGILYIPFIIEVETSINDSYQFIPFLPPTKDSNGKYTSSSRSANIEIGYFLTNDIFYGSYIYDFLLANPIIQIEIDDYEDFNFNYILDQCKNNQSLVPDLLKKQINDIVVNGVDSSVAAKVEQLLNECKLSFDFDNVIGVQYNESQKQFSTSSVAVQITSSNERNELIPYYKNGQSQAYPNVSIVVKGK